MFGQTKILKLFSSQYDLNTVYNGDSWKDNKFVALYQAAADVEFAEFLGELEGIWKWYYKGAVTNIPEATVEAIDVLHFQVAAVLTTMAAAGLSKDEIMEKVKLSAIRSRGLYAQEFPSSDFTKTYPRLRFYHGQILNSCYSMSRRNQMEGEWSSDFLLDEVISHINSFLAMVGSILNVDAEKLFRVYEAKNARCHDRVAKGIMNGVDVKKDEAPLDV